MRWFINIGFTPVEIVTAVIFCILLIYPSFKILQKIGFNGWLSVLVVIPFVSIIALWVLAFYRWPSDKPKEIKKAE